MKKRKLSLTCGCTGEGGDPLRPELLTPEPKPPKKRNFFLKFLELQTLMFQHNAGLTDSHPYASGPVNWPFLLSGISFWTGKQEDRQQIYLIGNIAGWWVSSASLAILAGVMMADAVARRRGFYPIPEGTCHCAPLLCFSTSAGLPA